MRISKGLLVLLAILFLSLSVIGCRTKGPIEQTGDAVGDAVKDTGEAIENVVR